MTTHQELKTRLRELLETLSLKKGPVVLVSGKTSNFYLDCKQTALNAEGAVVIGRLVFETIRRLGADGHRVEGVGGMTLGADPIAVATAFTSQQAGEPVHAFIIRKEPKGHGTRAWLEGSNNLREGAPVLLVEDVVTTGGSTLRALERAKESGLEPVAIVALVDREEGGRENLEATGLPFEALLCRSDFGVPPG
jgi:orotate phosphoribosyltransferase